jgi:hypothetical protein
MTTSQDMARAAIVKHLQSNPDKRFTLNSIARMSGMSQASIKIMMPELGTGFKSERTETNAISYYYTEKQFMQRWRKPFTEMTQASFKKHIGGVVSI